METILLLGGFGFIGSNMMDFIDNNLSQQYNVIVFDKVVHHPFDLNFKCVKKIYSGDFSDITCLEQIFDENKIDLILHFINTTVPSTSGNIKFDIQSNLISTIEFINLMIKAKVRKIIYLSSGGAIYGNSSEKKSESAQNYPQSSYGIVKLTVEKYLMLYSGQNLIDPLILRLSNPYGPYHFSMKQGIINVAIRSALEKKFFSVWGSGESLKDYIYIEDFAVILFRLVKLKINNTIINVGSEKMATVNYILSQVKNVYPNFTWNYVKAKNFDAEHFELNITKLKMLLGDYSFTSIEEGILKTNKWLINLNVKQ